MHNLTERKVLMRPDRVDPFELDVLSRAMADSGRTFVDIGANAGLYVLRAALQAGPGGRIVAIEPNTDLIDRLQFNVARATEAGLIGRDVRIDTVPLAISDKDGVAVLSDTGDEGSRSLVTNKDGIEVATARLSGVLAGLGVDRIDALKIDVEGHEDRALAPYFDDVAPEKWPRTIIIEHISRAVWRRDCIADCLGRGYSVVGTTNNNTILRHT